MVLFESLDTVYESHSIVTMSVSLAVSDICSINKWHDFENCVWGHSSTSKRCCPIDHVSIGRPL